MKHKQTEHEPNRRRQKQLRKSMEPIIEKKYIVYKKIGRTAGRQAGREGRGSAAAAGKQVARANRKVYK